MKKGFIVLMAIAGMLFMYACSQDDPIREDATTRGATKNDSTGGGITITINDEWAGDTTIQF